MNKLTMTGAAVLAALSLTGCSSEKEPEGVIPQGYKDAMDKADSVEDKLQDAAQLRMNNADDSKAD